MLLPLSIQFTILAFVIIRSEGRKTRDNIFHLSTTGHNIQQVLYTCRILRSDARRAPVLFFARLLLPSSRYSLFYRRAAFIPFIFIFFLSFGKLLAKGHWRQDNWREDALSLSLSLSLSLFLARIYATYFSRWVSTQPFRISACLALLYCFCLKAKLIWSALMPRG